MELTNAERQANYRERQKFGKQNLRLNAWVDARAIGLLEKLATGHNTTKRIVLEEMLTTFAEDLFFNEKLANLGKKANKVGKKAKK